MRDDVVNLDMRYFSSVLAETQGVRFHLISTKGRSVNLFSMRIMTGFLIPFHQCASVESLSPTLRTLNLACHLTVGVP